MTRILAGVLTLVVAVMVVQARRPPTEPARWLNPDRPHIEILLSDRAPSVRMFATADLSGSPIVELSGEGLFVDGRLACGWPGGGRFVAGHPSRMVLGYRDHEASDYVGCDADVPIRSFWYEEHGFYARLLLEVTSRHGTIARLTTNSREFFLDLASLPGDPRERDLDDTFPMEGFTAWVWWRSLRDTHLSAQVWLTQLLGNPGFVSFIVDVRACLASDRVPACLVPFVSPQVYAPAATSDRFYLSAEEFVQYLWTARASEGRLWEQIVGCFTRGGVAPGTEEPQLSSGAWVCSLDPGFRLGQVYDVDHEAEGIPTLDSLIPLDAPHGRVPVLVGVAEGGILPIGRYTGTQWVNTWPDAVETTYPDVPVSDAPVEWLGQPIPRHWRIHFVTGGTIAVTADVISGGGSNDGGCTFPRTIALNERVNLPDQLFDPQHHGIAVDTHVPVQSVQPVRPGSAAYRRAHGVVRGLFAAADRGAIRLQNLSGRESPSVLATRRFRETPVDLDALFVTEQGRYRTYYFEGARWFPDLGLRAVMGGWIVETMRGPQIVLESAYLFPVDAPAPATIDEWLTVANHIPLGVIPINDTQVWVMETPQGESTAFSIFDVMPTGFRTLLRTDAGGC